MSSNLTVYFAGALFSSKDLIGNALLAEEIHKVSNFRYLCILPQNYEQRETTSRAIRNQDLHLVATSDLGVFHFDGTELDSGTVVEYMVAKFLDIPCVIIRTDFRKSGDDETFPWNLMLSNFPRTKVIAIDGMASYQAQLKKVLGNEATSKPDRLQTIASAGGIASKLLSEELATQVVSALDEVLKQAPILNQKLSQHVYEWMRMMPGADFDKLLTTADLNNLFSRRKFS